MRYREMTELTGGLLKESWFSDLCGGEEHRRRGAWAARSMGSVIVVVLHHTPPFLSSPRRGKGARAADPMYHGYNDEVAYTSKAIYR